MYFIIASSIIVLLFLSSIVVAIWDREGSWAGVGLFVSSLLFLFVVMIPLAIMDGDRTDVTKHDPYSIKTVKADRLADSNITIKHVKCNPDSPKYTEYDYKIPAKYGLAPWLHAYDTAVVEVCS